MDARLPALLITALLLAGCGSTAKKASPRPAPPPSVKFSGQDACGPVPVFDPRAFPATPRVDNRWTPLAPGAQVTLTGTVTDQDGKHKHEVITTVTDLAKTVDGVPAVVVWDQDLQDGELQESEIYFTAQDRAGAVWLLGEFPAEYDNGKFSGAPDSWIGGAAQAQPGLTMPANPAAFTQGYRQGSAPSVKFLDCAKTYATGQTLGSYRDVLVTDEWGPLDPEGGHQRKYYAAGVGTVQVGAVGGDSQEVLTLTAHTRLCAADLDKVRARALEIDRKAYKTSAAIYSGTAPARQVAGKTSC